jgi:cell division transport system permease protein
MRASFLMSGVATGIRRNVSMTVALVLSTAISLAFLGGSFLMTKEIGKFRTIYEDKINVSIYLCTPTSNAGSGSRCTEGVTAAQQQALQARLEADPQITGVQYINEAQATNIAKQRLGAKAVEDAGPDAIPSSFTIKLKNLRTDYAPVYARYNTAPGVDVVQNQDDSLKTMLNLFDSARQAALVVAVIVLICAVIQMSNTIRVAAQQRRNETGIMRLVGASRWMTQLPFIVEAILAAVAGGVLAIVMVWVGKKTILDGVFGQQVSRGVLPQLDVNDVLVAGGVPLVAGIVLAAATAYVTLRLYVRL